MNEITHDHTSYAQARARDRKHARLLDLMRVRSTCMHVRTAIDRQK